MSYLLLCGHRGSFRDKYSLVFFDNCGCRGGQQKLCHESGKKQIAFFHSQFSAVWESLNKATGTTSVVLCKETCTQDCLSNIEGRRRTETSHLIINHMSMGIRQRFSERLTLEAINGNCLYCKNLGFCLSGFQLRISRSFFF